jgi:hypothetical protein
MRHQQVIEHCAGMGAPLRLGDHDGPHRKNQLTALQYEICGEQGPPLRVAAAFFRKHVLTSYCRIDFIEEFGGIAKFHHHKRWNSGPDPIC